MNYSFTPPGKKTLLTKVSRIWWGYIFLTLFIFGGFVGTLKVQGYLMQKRANQAILDREMVIGEIKASQEELLKEQEHVKFGESILHQNNLLQESVKNLFELIPEQITLTKIEMTQYQLTLYGITPSKQIYSFLLEVPLRSIFDESRVEFYTLSNGWYNFISVSKLMGPHQ